MTDLVQRFLTNMLVKELLKSVDIWWRYELEYGVAMLSHSRCSVVDYAQYAVVEA